MRLSERALLTVLHIGSWAGTMYDQAVSVDVSNIKKAETGAGRYNKQLMDRKVLRPVNAAVSVARQTHRLLTLPWDDGARILAATGHQHYTESMQRCRLSLQANVGDLLKLYPAYVASQENKKRLGSMYKAEDYPSVSDLKSKFYVDVEIKPVPEAGDFRTKLSNDATKAIAADIERRTNERLEAAMNDVFERIVEATRHMVERLRAYKPGTDVDRPESNFRDATVYNIHELAELLPSLNITGDPRFEELRKQLKKDLVSHSPEVLKTDKKIRADVASKAEALMKKAKSFMA